MSNVLGDTFDRIWSNFDKAMKDFGKEMDEFIDKQDLPAPTSETTPMDGDYDEIITEETERKPDGTVITRKTTNEDIKK